MRKILILAAMGAAFAAFDAANAALEAVRLEKGDNSLGMAGKVVSARAASTNQTGTVTVAKVTPFTVWEFGSEVVTNISYGTATTNLYRTATNDIFTAWRTMKTGNGAVTSNVYAQAVNEIPEYPPLPDIVVTSNRVVEVESYTNWTYQVETARDIVTNTLWYSVTKEATNGVASITLSSGFGESSANTIVYPGELLRLAAPGDEGEYWIVIER